MKFIDEKGRLFGKINVIDFLAILLLICLTPMFYYGYRLFKKPKTLSKELTEMELDCKFIKIKPEILKLITVGDKEIDKTGKVIGEIVKIGKSKLYQYMFNLGPDNEIPIICKNLREIPARLKIMVEIKANGLYYKNKLFSLNPPIEFKTNRYSAIVIPFVEKKKKKRLKEIQVELKVKFSGVFPELAEIITEGDTEKDLTGKVTARLTKIISDQFSDVLTLRDDIFVKISHPFHRDIVVLTDFLCTEKERTLYFKNYPVKIGNRITFATDSYSISGIIIGLELK